MTVDPQYKEDGCRLCAAQGRRWGAPADILLRIAALETVLNALEMTIWHKAHPAETEVRVTSAWTVSPTCSHADRPAKAVWRGRRAVIDSVVRGSLTKFSLSPAGGPPLLLWGAHFLFCLS